MFPVFGVCLDLCFCLIIALIIKLIAVLAEIIPTPRLEIYFGQCFFPRCHSERSKEILHELNSIGNQFCWPMDFIAHRVERRKSYPGKCWMILALKPDRNWKKNTIPSARKKSRRFYEPSMKVLSAYYGRWFSKFSATRYSAIVVLEADTHADLCRKSVNCHLSLRNRKIESREKQHSR